MQFTLNEDVKRTTYHKLLVREFYHSCFHTDWSDIEASARRHGLAPLLYASLQAREPQNQAEARVLNNLRMAYIRAHVANWQAFEELSRVLECFERADIPAILLKGSALVPLLYADIALRPLGDLDMLIPHSALARAGALLVQQGYSPLPELADRFQERFANEQAFYRGGKHPAQVDLHWHVFPHPHYRERIPIEWFWQRTMDIRMNGRAARTLAPEAQLVHLASHFALQHGGARLMWSYDIALLLARYSVRMNWDEVLDAACAFGLVETLQRTFTHVGEIWGVHIPCDVLARLNVLHPIREERILHRMVRARHSHARLLWDGLSVRGMRRRFEYWLQHAFPSVAFMRTRYRINHMRFLPLYYLWRVSNGAFKIIRSAISIALDVCVKK